MSPAGLPNSKSALAFARLSPAAPFVISATSTVPRTVQATLPKGSVGFAATLALVAVHMLLVSIVPVWFCSNVKFSIIESAWSCTLQGSTLMANEQDKELLTTAHLRNDSHIEKLFCEAQKA